MCVGVALLLLATEGVGGSIVVGWGIWALVVGGVIALPMIFSSLVGKVRVRDRVLTGLRLRGDEDVLDLGCGSGLMLLGAASRCPHGSATGIDLWRSRDQAGSSRARCWDNAERLGVTDRVHLIDGDIAELPCEDESFDIVLACLAVHNLHPDSRRERAIAEAARVLRPGGRLAIIDIFGTRSYVRVAGSCGLVQVQRSGLLAGLFPPGRLVTAQKP